jgi:hypothetical protein
MRHLLLENWPEVMVVVGFAISWLSLTVAWF